MPYANFPSTTKHVHFEDDKPKDPRPRHHHGHHHHAYPQPIKVIYIDDDYDYDEPMSRRHGRRHHHHHHHHSHQHQSHNWTRPVMPIPRFVSVPPPPPRCHGCRLTFKSDSDLERHRLRKPRHCPQHLTCFSDWTKHCFEFDHIKCPRSECRDLPPFRDRQKCLEHLRAWHTS